MFYHVTDGDGDGSGELHAHVARIWLQGSHRACACFQNHCNDVLLRYFRGMPVAGNGKFSDEFLLHRRRKTANLIDS